MKSLYINGIGVMGPGIDSWQECASVLTGKTPYQYREYETPKPEIMPRTILRRANAQIRLGVAVAEEAVRNAGVNANECAQVFSSSEGDGKTEHDVCVGVSGEEPFLSPILFHNSVHNAAAGNWAITAQNQKPSTSIDAYDASFANGLIEAACQVLIENEQVLLVCHDTRAPDILNDLRPILDSFGVACVLSARPLANCIAKLTFDIVPLDTETSVDVVELEPLRASNPAARALSLLSLLANHREGSVHLSYGEYSGLNVEVTPWS